MRGDFNREGVLSQREAGRSAKEKARKVRASRKSVSYSVLGMAIRGRE
ncbi:hypothetical protein EV700_2076 [Fluviicoccus keumensis]|uniref:Uncharacterized protein n=1 Tax=Fluviicoccus keumensis TaxID=1435465 RepID=A0A4Q7Z4M6_9GAMM|nr:hypothetical protein EV700_2076 [Fluviicoccus keumensis]